MDDRTIARNVGDRNNPKTIRLLGHNVYVRRCRVPDIKDENGKVLIYLVDKVPNMTRDEDRDDPNYRPPYNPNPLNHNSSNCCEVLAIGPKVGKPRDGKRLPGVAICYDMSMLKTGDFVYLPVQSGNGLMWRGGLGEDSELIVDESELIAVIPQGEGHG